MKKAYSNQEILAAERAAFSEVSPEALMQAAGTALGRHVRGAMARLLVNDVVVVVGTGNNGGDGYVAAQALLQSGADVTVVAVGPPKTEEARRAREQYRGEILEVFPRRRFALAVDCLFGTGLTRPIEGKYADAVDFLNGCDRVIACDVPSGLRESGYAEGAAVKAWETVCFGGLKSCLLLGQGADLAGDIEVVPLPPMSPQGGADVFEDADIARFFPSKPSHSNKGNYGTAAIVAGEGSLGAPLLSAGAALKSGAGYTKLFLPDALYPAPASLLEVVSRLPACIFKRHGLEEIVRADAVAFGMGAGVCEQTEVLLGQLIVKFRGTLVLDADALNVLSRRPALLKERVGPTILTPHLLEFSRLTGVNVGELRRDLLGFAQAFAREYGVVLILKDNRSVITDGVRTAINRTGSAVLSKGGSGDVLAGFVAGSAARGLAGYEAAVLGCYLLGRAGELAAEAMGEYAPDATDIIARFPCAMRALS